MNLVFDIDDTIVDETGFMLKKAPQYLKKCGIKSEIRNPNGYNLAEVFGLESILRERGCNREEIIEKSKAIETGFWNRYFLAYTFRPCKKGVRKMVNKLRKAGIHIYFISCRGKKTKEADTIFSEFIRLKVVPFLTVMQLKRSFIKYNQIKLVKSEDEKIDFIKKVHAKYVFDDQMRVLWKLPEYSQAVCVRTLHNANELSNGNISLFVSTFEDDQVSEAILKDYKTEKHKKKTYVTYWEQKRTELFYVLNRCLLKSLVIRRFHPIVYDIENIPADKRPIIYVGNHRNNLDPVITTLYLKRPVHWCALLRLFEAKENLFGRNDIWILRKFSSLFIKSIGAIPIARSNDDNYRKVNVSSLLKANEYIRRGSSIGFFPEGTINRKPEDLNLLPLVSDTIFSLAKRTGAWLQPFSIVWFSQEEIQHKVAIAFSEPIEPEGLSVKDIRTKWEQAVNCNIERIKQNMAERV